MSITSLVWNTHVRVLGISSCRKVCTFKQYYFLRDIKFVPDQGDFWRVQIGAIMNIFCFAHCCEASINLHEVQFAWLFISTLDFSHEPGSACGVQHSSYGLVFGTNLQDQQSITSIVFGTNLQDDVCVLLLLRFLQWSFNKSKLLF